MRPILVDVSRTMSRAFTPIPTGIDRVERAYISHVLDRPGTLFVARLRSTLFILDANGMAQILARIEGAQPWSNPARFQTFIHFSDQNGAALAATLHEFAVFSGRLKPVADRISETIGRNGWYLNVGHTNLASDWLHALKAVARLRICVMIHDLIPLEFPQYQTDASVKRFKDRFLAVMENADVILTNSHDTAERVRGRIPEASPKAKIHPVPLGIEPPERLVPRSENLPYFIMLGTIEPRKNHMTILRAWELLPKAERPVLHIVGKRGWRNRDVFHWLDTSPLSGNSVMEHGPLPDEETRHLLAGARALLFPSLAEGFGLPVLEALQLGVPVVANRLPVLEELAGNSLLYMDSQDAKVWSTIISRIAKSSRADIFPEGFDRVTIPRWAEHFQQVDTILT